MTLQSSCKAQNLSATFFQGTIPARAGALVTQTKVTERFGLLQSTVHMILKKVKRKQICHAPRKAACRPRKLNKRQEGLLIRYVTSLHKEDCNYFTDTRLIKKKKTNLNIPQVSCGTIQHFYHSNGYRDEFAWHVQIITPCIMNSFVSSYFSHKFSLKFSRFALGKLFASWNRECPQSNIRTYFRAR